MISLTVQQLEQMTGTASTMESENEEKSNGVEGLKSLHLYQWFVKSGGLSRELPLLLELATQFIYMLIGQCVNPLWYQLKPLW